MATKIYLDKRSAKKDGTYPLKISVSYKGAYTLIPTGIYLLPEHSRSGHQTFILQENK